MKVLENETFFKDLEITLSDWSRLSLVMLFSKNKSEWLSALASNCINENTNCEIT